MATAVRTRYIALAEHVVSTFDIAEACGVGVSAVCNWTRRWEDFPAPMDVFGNVVIYPRDEVSDCLARHGRQPRW